MTPNNPTPLAAHEQEMLLDLLTRASAGPHELGGSREEQAGDYCPVFTTETEVYPGTNSNEAGPLAIFTRRVDAALFAVSQAYIPRLLAEATTLRTRLQEAEDAGAAKDARLKRFDDIIRHNGMMSPDLSHVEVAGKVRMLTRSDLDHEMVTVLARNRIITLANLLGEAEAKLAREGEQEAQLLKRDEELRGLLGMLEDAEHWMAVPATSNSDRYTVGELSKRIRLALQGSRHDARRQTAKEALSALLPSAPDEDDDGAALPLQGEEGKGGDRG